MLRRCKIIAFVNTANTDAARKFYCDTLGLRLVSEDQFALVFDANGTMLRVAIAPEVTPARYTVLGWQVPDIVATARQLIAAGVQFERFPGLNDREELASGPRPAAREWAGSKIRTAISSASLSSEIASATVSAPNQ